MRISDWSSDVCSSDLASQDKLDAAVKTLEDAGHTDALPGANVEAKPETTDPEIAANLVEPEKAPSLEDSAMSENIANPPKPDAPKEKPKAGDRKSTRLNSSH